MVYFWFLLLELSYSIRIHVISPHLVSRAPHCMRWVLILYHATLIACDESSSCVMQASLRVMTPHLVSYKRHCVWWVFIMCLVWLSLHVMSPHVMSCAPNLLSHAHHPSPYPTWCHTTVGPSRRHYLMYHWLWGSCLGQGEAADPTISSAEHTKEKSKLVHWMCR